MNIYIGWLFLATILSLITWDKSEQGVDHWIMWVACPIWIPLGFVLALCMADLRRYGAFILYTLFNKK